MVIFLFLQLTRVKNIICDIYFSIYNNICQHELCLIIESESSILVTNMSFTRIDGHLRTLTAFESVMNKPIFNTECLILRDILVYDKILTDRMLNFSSAKQNCSILGPSFTIGRCKESKLTIH